MIFSNQSKIPKILLDSSPTSDTFQQASLLSRSPTGDPADSHPPTSPTLPYPISHHGQKPGRLCTRKVLRLFCWVFGILIVGWFAWPYIHPYDTMSTVTKEESSHSMNFSQDGEEYELVGGDELPDEPVPIVVTDSQGQTRWTVSIPPKLEFPLAPADYSGICSKTGGLAHHVATMVEEAEPARKRFRRWKRHGKAHHGYYYEDPNFMDVEDAEAEGLLPSVKDDDGSNDGREICNKSLTFVMQTEDAGLGKSLLRLWMSYGLAQKEGRAFFIEDANWAYGKYTTYFQPPPTQDCRPPPRNHRIPCPHEARHLVISSSTTSWAFGHGFTDEFENPRKMAVERQEPIFDLLRTGYEALFKLADEDAAYYNKRVNALNASVRAEGGIQVGLHVRHGDAHPREFQYQKSYLPLEKYVTAAEELISGREVGSSGKEEEEPSDEEVRLDINTKSSKMIFASDDPDVYSAEELKGAEKAQYKISLASKSALDAVAESKGSSSSSTAPSTKGGENIGWEGGFYKDIFWSLGAPSFDRGGGLPGNPYPSSFRTTKRQMPDQTAHSVNLAALWKDAEHDFHFHPTPEALRLRELVGRGYLLDLAVLGQADRVVCGINSSGCRILAVMMGWEKGIVEKGWNNIDGSWHWKGIVW